MGSILILKLGSNFKMKSLGPTEHILDSPGSLHPPLPTPHQQPLFQHLSGWSTPQLLGCQKPRVLDLTFKRSPSPQRSNVSSLFPELEYGNRLL